MEYFLDLPKFPDSPFPFMKLQETPLMLAAEEGSIDVVNYLIRKQDVDIKDVNEVFLPPMFLT